MVPAAGGPSRLPSGPGTHDNTRVQRNRWRSWFFPTLLLGLGFAAVASLLTGSADIGAGELVRAISGAPDTETSRTIIVDIRLPRLGLGLIVGAALAAAGAAMQGLFRNPLADPSLIGVSAGAAVGAVAAIALLGHWITGAGHPWTGLILPVFAFLGSCAATATVYALSKLEGRTVVATMLLAGIAINALAAAAVGLFVFVADSRELRDFTFWSLGSLAQSSWGQLFSVIPFILVPVVLLPRFARPLNALLLGEAEAHHLGVDVQRVKERLVLLCAAMVGASVAVAGIIGFVGLVVPHLVRLAIGPDHRSLLPGSALLGALLLVLADLLARTLVRPGELPVGILTALVGAPFFLGLLHFSRGRVWG